MAPYRSFQNRGKIDKVQQRNALYRFVCSIAGNEKAYFSFPVFSLSLWNTMHSIPFPYLDFSFISLCLSRSVPLDSLFFFFFLLHFRVSPPCWLLLLLLPCYFRVPPAVHRCFSLVAGVLLFSGAAFGFRFSFFFLFCVFLCASVQLTAAWWRRHAPTPAGG